MSKLNYNVVCVCLTLLFSGSAIAEDISYLPVSDPVMLKAVNKCIKIIERSNDKIDKFCGKNLDLMDKIEENDAKLVNTIQTNNAKKDSYLQNLDNSCDNKELSIYNKMADIQHLSDNIGNIISCIGGLFDFGDDSDCLAKQQKALQKYAAMLVKYGIALDKLHAQCDAKEAKTKQSTLLKNSKAENSTTSKNNKIQNLIVKNNNKIAAYQQKVVECGGDAHSC